MMMTLKELWQRLMQTSVKGVIAPSAVPDEMLINRLTEHEGIKKYAYIDSLGYTSVGIGRCIDSRIGAGLSVDECFYLLRNDITASRARLKSYDWYVGLDDVRADAIVELEFNMGISHLLGFVKMIDALKRKSFIEASKELLDSKWAQQVGAIRSKDLAYRIFNGRYI